MSEVVEIKPKKAKKAKAKSKKSAGKKVVRGLKEAVAKAATPEEIERFNNEVVAAENAPSLEQVEKEIAAFYADAQPLKYGFFERAYDNLMFGLREINKRIPRLVWIGQRIEVDVRWDQAKNAITVHYYGPFKKVK